MPKEVRRGRACWAPFEALFQAWTLPRLIKGNHWRPFWSIIKESSVVISGRIVQLFLMCLRGFPLSRGEVMYLFASFDVTVNGTVTVKEILRRLKNAVQLMSWAQERKSTHSSLHCSDIVMSPTVSYSQCLQPWVILFMQRAQRIRYLLYLSFMFCEYSWSIHTRFYIPKCFNANLSIIQRMHSQMTRCAPSLGSFSLPL